MKVPDKEFFKTINKHLPKIKNGFFIECGANTGIEGSVGYIFEHKLGWKGLNIEPNRACFPLLQMNRPKCINENKALTNKIEIKDFYVPLDGKKTKFADRSSLNKIKNERNLTYKVECCTYEDLIQLYKIKKVDVFILDVEGYENIVLETMLNVSVLPTIIAIEYDKIDVERMKFLLNEMNYKKIDNYKNNYIYRRNK